MEKKTKVQGLRGNLIAEAGFNISWPSIFAGTVTFFATLALLSLIGSAIGFGVVEPTSSDPMAGVGTGVLIWTIITLILAFMAGGFVAGVSSRRIGILHGFLTWATSVLILVVMLATLTTSAISAVGNLLGNAFSIAGSGAASIGSSVGDLVESSVDTALDNLGDINTDEVEMQMKDILRDTETPELQPGYLNDQLKEAGDEVVEAGKNVLLNPEDTEKIATELIDSLKAKATKIGESVDRDAVANSVAANTDLTEAEAQEATDNIYNGLQKASKEAERALNKASQNIERAKVKIDQTVEDARVQAERAADATSKASIWAFIGLAIALVLTSMSGVWGSNYVRTHNEEKM